jgi:integrase
MARKRSDGFRLVKDERTGIQICRFWFQGRDHKLSTRTRDLAEARRVGAQIYSETISGRRRVDAPKRGPLAPIVAEWLATIEPPIVSQGDWERCEQTWRVQLLPRFPYIETLTPASIEDFYRTRLREVARETVRKDRAVLLRFVKWASMRGRDYLHPIEIPQLSKKAKGVPAIQGRGVTKVDRAEVLAILQLLPRYSERKHKPVRALVTLAAEYGLRAELLQKLRVPEHYQLGDLEIRITAEIDKEGEARTLELTPLARLELEAIAPTEGLIFGRYDYRRTLRKAAALVIGEERAQYLSLRDLRHAALTDLAEVTQSVGAVAAVAGHRDLRTTSRYFNARERAATAALRARSEADRQLESGRITGTITGTGLSGRSAEIILPRKNRDGRVAQLDRALPSGGRSRGFESLRVR